MTTPEQALLARKTWRTVEPLHGMIYFVPEAAEAYARLGIEGRDGYFSSRSAPMGAVAADVVIATFFNFNPELIHSAIPKAWQLTTPEELVKARLAAVDGACRRLLGDAVLSSQEMVRAADIARRLAELASTNVAGRPLAAGHVNLQWPEQPHLVLWHAQSILREFRGDAHIALLVTHGLSGIDALITHAAAGDVPAHLLRSSRGWSSAQWDEAVVSMRQRGWITDGDDPKLTDWGATQRQEIEDQTDVLAADPYATVDEEDCAELRTLVRPWSKIFSDVLFR